MYLFIAPKFCMTQTAKLVPSYHIKNLIFHAQKKPRLKKSLVITPQTFSGIFTRDRVLTSRRRMLAEVFSLVLTKLSVCPIRVFNGFNSNEIGSSNHIYITVPNNILAIFSAITAKLEIALTHFPCNGIFKVDAVQLR